MLICPTCNSRTHEDYDRCVNCGADVGFPNVRSAEAERPELNSRYDAAMRDAAGRGATGVVKAFEQAAAQSQAVVNIKRRQLESMVEEPNIIYTNYYNLVDGCVRMPASSENDRCRSSIDDLLFGSIVRKKITFVAINIGGRGLISYGDYALTLRESMIKNRISLLEENSFDFVRRNRIDSFNFEEAPKGYRAVWSDRGRLAVAKLASKLSNMTPKNEFGKILLYSDGDRASDRFIEGHLYGFFTFEAIAKVTGPNGDDAVSGKLRDLTDATRVTWEQV